VSIAKKLHSLALYHLLSLVVPFGKKASLPERVFQQAETIPDMKWMSDKAEGSEDGTAILLLIVAMPTTNRI
jgi:hypothetical protein